MPIKQWAGVSGVGTIQVSSRSVEPSAYRRFTPRHARLATATMFPNSARLIALCLLLLAGSAGVWLYQHNSVEQQLVAERQKTEQLKLIVTRLSAERRVADVVVSEQGIAPGTGTLRTTLLFVEYDHNGEALPARKFTIDGKMAHIDAMVVKFAGKFVEDNDPLRGHSIALFTRLYGDKQSPDAAQHIDEPGTVPAVYRGADHRISEFEMDLWKNFWKLADDPAYRQKSGVRVAQGEGVWRPFEPGFVYTLTLENNGGLNITSEPVKGIYKELLHEHADMR